MADQQHVFAIIGLGPRGHHALESLARAIEGAAEDIVPLILAFEPGPNAGHGHVYTVEQPASNWINITERVLDLPAREVITLRQGKIPPFPGYLEWAGLVFDDWPADRVDTFPPRAKIGKYLAERFETLANPLLEFGVLKIIDTTVDELSISDRKPQIKTDDGAIFTADQVLITIGHQPTEDDEQIADWKNAVRRSDGARLFDEPYPVQDIAKAVANVPKVHVAVRGYGLATIDVARAMAGTIGQFVIDDDITRKQHFCKNDGADLKIIPFSLDGLPPGPKPLTPAIDAQFEPSSAVMEKLRHHISDKNRQIAATDQSFLIDIMCDTIATVWSNMHNRRSSAATTSTQIANIAAAWIDDPFFKHDLVLCAHTPPEEILQRLVAIASGAEEITLDYCVGQVWRHCQPLIYKELSHSELSDPVMAQIIFTDEKLKRYTYGPPVESLQQLIALNNAGVLELGFIADPSIEVDGTAWTLSSDDAEISASIMINAVLDPPKVKKVCSPLVTGLLNNNMIKLVHTELGVTTDTDAFCISNENTKTLPIALLGRLAKGTVIGVDAILECFGDRAEFWAKAAVEKAASNNARV